MLFPPTSALVSGLEGKGVAFYTESPTPELPVSLTRVRPAGAQAQGGGAGGMQEAVWSF